MAGRVVLSVDSFVRAGQALLVRPRQAVPPHHHVHEVQAVDWRGVRGGRLDLSPIRSGRWRPSRSYHGRGSPLDVDDVPMGDSDASLSAMKDALQESGLLDDTTCA